MASNKELELSLVEEILEYKLHTKTLMLEDDLKYVSVYTDEDRIKKVFDRAYLHIEEILHEEHGYSEAEIERKFEDIFADTKKYVGALVERARGQEIQDKLFNVHQDADLKVWNHSDFGKKEVEDVNKLKNEILNSTHEVLANTPEDQSKNVALIQDTISTEMKYQIKRALNIYDDPRGEEAFYEVSRYLDNRLSEEMVQNYLEGSKDLNKSIEELYTEVLDQVISEYSIEKEKQDEKNKSKDTDEIAKDEDPSKEESKTKFQESLQSATKTEAEIVKTDIETKPELDKKKEKDENLITHVID